MPRFDVRQTAKLNLTSYSGLALIGQCCQAAQLEAVIDPKLPVSQGMKTSDIVKSAVGLLSLGKSDFEAIEPFRDDRFFKESLGLSKVPGSVWIRQRLDAKASPLRELTDELSLRLLERTEAPITAHKGYTCADMDNSDTKKELVIHLAAFALNCLRFLGQLGLTGEVAPIRHPARRRRLKTVLQEVMYRAAKFVRHARRLVPDFGRGVGRHAEVFMVLQDRLWRAASP